MALNNDNNPHVMVIPLGSPAVDAVVFGGMSAGKKLEILSAHIVDAGGIAESDSDFVEFSLLKAAVAVAAYDTRAAGEGAITASVPAAMTLVDAQKIVAAGELITVDYDETDSGTAVALTNAVCIINYQVK